MAASSAVGHASRVGQHYSQVKQVGLDKRDEARIIKMRNFNNFIKSLLINMYTNQGEHYILIKGIILDKVFIPDYRPKVYGS